MKLLITGASGFVGGRVARELARRWPVVGCAQRARDGWLGVDLAAAGACEALLDEQRPQAVLNCAAMADPDACERDPGRAQAVNAASAGALAAACARRGVRLIHVSTDLVFDGAAPPYGEDDATAPLSVYGRVKLEAERLVLRECPSAAVVRVALVYGRSFGRGRPSFLDWLLGELDAGRRPRLFVDQWRTPTPVAQLPEVFARLVERPDLRGVFHWSGAERVSRLEFGARVCAVFGRDERLLTPAKMADVPSVAARPGDVSLRCEKLPRALGLAPLSLEAGLRLER